MTKRVAVLLAAVGITGALGSPSAEAEVGDLVPATVGAAKISTWHRPGPSASGHLFTFQVMIDACPALLEVDHTTLAERPKTGSRRGAAIVTAYVREPEHQVTGAPCPPLPPLFETVQVKTKRPVSELIFFDGSSSPPRRVYPPRT